MTVIEETPIELLSSSLKNTERECINVRSAMRVSVILDTGNEQAIPVDRHSLSSADEIKVEDVEITIGSACNNSISSSSSTSAKSTRLIPCLGTKEELEQEVFTLLSEGNITEAEENFDDLLTLVEDLHIHDEIAIPNDKHTIKIDEVESIIDALHIEATKEVDTISLESEPEIETPLGQLLRLCEQPRAIDFSTHISGLLDAKFYLRKIGEASYSEVFEQYQLEKKGSVVLKIIPFGGRNESPITDILQEVRTTKTMSNVDGFIGFRR